MLDFMGYMLHRNRMHESVDPFDNGRIPMLALAEVKVKALNVRNEPTTQSFKTEMVTKGDVLGCNVYAVDNEGNTWYHVVRDNSEHVGWVLAKYCYPQSLEDSLFNSADENVTELMEHIHECEEINRRKNGYGKI